MKRKRKTVKPKPLNLRDQVGALGKKMTDMALIHAHGLADMRIAVKKIATETNVTNLMMEQLKDTPLAVIKNIDRILGKLEDLGLDKAEKIDAIFPNIRDQFNAMAEAVNKISAYAKALEESETGFRLRKETRERYAEETDEELLAKLKHRLKRMEQKL